MGADPDSHLVEAALDGDKEAFESLASRHERSIYMLVLRMCNDPDEAPDIVQKIFLRAYIKLQTFRRRSSFKTWLYAIAINLCRNELRRRYRWGSPKNVEEVDPGVEPGLDEQLTDSERKRRLAAAVELLPPKQKAVLLLRIHEEMSFQNIAKVVGISENSAKVNFHHAVRRLQKDLRETR